MLAGDGHTDVFERRSSEDRERVQRREPVITLTVPGVIGTMIQAVSRDESSG